MAPSVAPTAHGTARKQSYKGRRLGAAGPAAMTTCAISAPVGSAGAAEDRDLGAISCLTRQRASCPPPGPTLVRQALALSPPTVSMPTIETGPCASGGMSSGRSAGSHLKSAGKQYQPPCLGSARPSARSPRGRSPPVRSAGERLYRAITRGTPPSFRGQPVRKDGPAVKFCPQQRESSQAIPPWDVASPTGRGRRKGCSRGATPRALRAAGIGFDRPRPARLYIPLPERVHLAVNLQGWALGRLAGQRPARRR